MDGIAGGQQGEDFEEGREEVGGWYVFVESGAHGGQWVEEKGRAQEK